MKLLHADSPYTRKARVVLARKEIDSNSSLTAPADKAPGFRNYNPLGKVPVLVLDDDTTLFDSRVIVEYLDNASPVQPADPGGHAPAYPGAPLGGARRRLHRCGRGGRLKSADRADQQIADWIARQQGKVDARAEGDGGRPRLADWCSGDFFNSRGHRGGLRARLSRLRAAGHQLAHDHPNLVKLYEKLQQRAVRSATRRLPDGAHRPQSSALSPRPRPSLLDDPAAQADAAFVDHHRLPGRDRPLRLGEFHFAVARRPPGRPCTARLSAGSGFWRRRPSCICGGPPLIQLQLAAPSAGRAAAPGVRGPARRRAGCSPCPSARRTRRRRRRRAVPPMPSPWRWPSV